MDFFNDINRFSASTALIMEDSNSYTYGQLLDFAENLCEHIDKRCLVFSVCRNNFESVGGYIGFLRSKIVPLLLSDVLDRDLFEALLQQYRPEYVWLPLENAEQLKRCIKIYGHGDYVLLKTQYDIDYALHDDLALLLTTSGSTGSFKLVRQSYKNIISNAQSIAQYLGITDIDRPITTLPMSYTFGLSIINSHFLRGCSLILTDKTLMDKTFWELLKRYEATTFSGVPYIYEILKKLRFSKMELPSLRTLTQAGGKLNLELSREFAETCKKKNMRFFVMYGQTEATARMSYLPSEFAISKVGSMGIAIPGGRFWLEDGNGVIINESDVVGELVYQGDNVTMGYAVGSEDLSRGYDNGDILKTGDMAKRDNDGFYYIVGRKKRFLKLFGNRVNLDEIEQLLKCAGHDCACAGEDDSMKIYTTDISKREKIRNFVSERTGIHHSGFEVVHIEAIPRNDSGKTLYFALK